ncbi:hypothetical protein Acr_00g0040240 [Actinidia rufa]|uniref:Reverse transcriptase domain-containing protein n=1 Tax=Actinidia rufa TaxID=165716 RepID=A0A7J0DHM6_9ERIC|nr:hypothetical protein Acr_00g0040240 [Actinidia rufa]
MPRLFRFGNETISSFPVWVQLRYVPMDMWNATVFGKICSLIVKVNLNFSGGGIYEQPIFYENLPRFCTHCRIMGHSKEGCKANKVGTNLVQPPKSTEVGAEKEKGIMAANTEVNGQAETFEAGTNKGNQMEWVTKKSRAEKGKSDNTEVRKATETQTHNQFSALEVIPEADGDQTQKSGVEGTAQNLTVGPAPDPEPTPDYAKEESQSKVTKHIKEQQSSILKPQKEVQLGEAGTVKQNKANTEAKTVEKSGPMISEKKGAAQPPRRSITAILAAKNSGKSHPYSSYNPAPVKGEEARKKKDKKGPEKNSKPTSFEEFCAEMGGNGVLNYVRRNKVDIMGILEIKLSKQSLEKIARRKFRSWKVEDNFLLNPNGRILILWKEEKVQLQIIESTDQVIHCLAICKSTSIKFTISFIYAFNSIMGRRPLWDNLGRFNASFELPWMLLGDFNNVLSRDEKANGLPVTMYEIRDFKNCCYDISISDLRSTGTYLTWSNSSVWCKLDRAMVNSKWTSQANFDLSGKLSDHSPCTVSLFGDNARGNCPFKFFNMWARHDKYPEIVSNTWRMQIKGSAMFRLCRKLRCLKSPLRALNKHSFSHISARAEAAEDELTQAQQQLHDNPANSDIQSLVLELRQKAIKLAEADLSYCSQLAKSKYLKNCDKGTKFFHNLIKSNRAKNHIASISHEDGSRTSSQKQVGDAFVQYYKGLLGTKIDYTRLNRDTVLQGKLLDADQADCLLRPISDEDIKVISKILAARMAEVLPSIIDPAQAAFVHKRSMKDNIFLLQELLRQYGRKRSTPRCILNVDLRKAFNSLDWDFVHDMLLSLQFPLSNRGLRQGDPLSPYLFVICLEYLSRSLGGLKENPDFNFPPKCGSLKITHLAFADDLVLLSRGDVTSVAMLINTLNHFGDCSGLRVSIAKSSLFTAGICSQDMDTIKEITGFTQGSFPFRYLGIPVADSRLTIAQYGPLIDKITGHISAWAGANLSYVGRIELIKSVLQGQSAFGSPSSQLQPGFKPKSSSFAGIFSGVANAARIRSHSPLIKQVMGLRDEIIATEQSQPAAAQKINQWTANGDLHSKLAYDYFRPKANKLKWPTVIWSNYTTPKHAFILWLAMKERLLTKDRLPDPGADQTCLLCRTENETTEHLFFQCNFVRQIWSPIKSWLGFRRTLSTLKAAVKWSIKEARGTGIQSKAKRLGIACTTYFVWEARNLRLFEGRVQAPEAVIRKIQISVYRVLINSQADSAV